MAVAVELPELGESVVEGTVARWLVKEGDRVEMDQPLVEVTTDKVDAEIPAPAAGVVTSILIAEGETIPVGTELARIDTEAAAGAQAPPEKSEAEEAAEEAEEPARAAPVREPAPESESTSSEPTSKPTRAAPAVSPAPPAADGPRATPVARRVAESARVDLRAVPASGVSGRITREDVVDEIARRPAPPELTGRAAPAKPGPAPAAKAGPGVRYAYEPREGDRVVPMSPLRKLVAEHMVYSKQTSPHVGTVAELDMGGVVAARNQHKRSFQETHGFSLTFLPFIVHAAVRALREHPALNASVVDDSIVEKRDIHIGIAVETEKGLMVPVVRNADRLSLTGLAAAIDDLSTRARNKKLSADDLKGGTFTISNPGRQGNLYGFAIINQPQVGILRIGEIVKRPVVRTVDGSDAIVIRPMMHLALSYDHRAVDGAPANAFLFHVRTLLEQAEFDL